MYSGNIFICLCQFKQRVEACLFNEVLQRPNYTHITNLGNWRCIITQIEGESASNQKKFITIGEIFRYLLDIGFLKIDSSLMLDTTFLSISITILVKHVDIVGST